MDVQYFCKRALQSCEGYEMIWREMSTVVALQIRVMAAGGGRALEGGRSQNSTH